MNNVSVFTLMNMPFWTIESFLLFNSLIQWTLQAVFSSKQTLENCIMVVEGIMFYVAFSIVNTQRFDSEGSTKNFNDIQITFSLSEIVIPSE